MREIRFRAWDGNNMLQNHEINGNWLLAGDYGTWHVMQFTGFKDSNSNDIYEMDIKRDEIEDDQGDTRFYFVCCWIKEWGMFAWLSIEHGEYREYQTKGVEALDESMFWSYPLDEDESPTICGNVFTHPKLFQE